jgi:signal peptidase II
MATTLTPNRRIALTAIVILALDQLTKFLVMSRLQTGEEWVVIDGFFRFVHWGNTGAAWSMFHGNNELLAIVSLVAVLVLFLMRRHFEIHTLLGQCALGLMFGGIIGNLIDRLEYKHVVDFLRFYLKPRFGEEVGFPAFNIADSAICVGVGLLFILSWRVDSGARSAEAPGTKPG